MRAVRVGQTKELLTCCVLPALQAPRAALLAARRRQGIPAATQKDLLFPAQHHTQVFKAVVRFLEDTVLTTRL